MDLLFFMRLFKKIQVGKRNTLLLLQQLRIKRTAFPFIINIIIIIAGIICLGYIWHGACIALWAAMYLG